MYLIIMIMLASCFLLFNILIFLFKLKIERLENKIIFLFNKRNLLIPSIFEVSKVRFIKHKEIFVELLKLKKIHFSQHGLDKNLFEIIKTQTLIHNELNFIFKVFSKHPKLYKNEKFIYINDLILENNTLLSKKLDLYKKVIKKYNHLINIKDITIIGLFIPLNIKENI